MVSKLLRARLVLPLSGPVISDGAVLVRDRRIAACGAWRDLKGRAGAREVDLGDVVVLPGLINAHCHLDYTHLAGMLPPPRRFTDWLKLIVTSKAGLTAEDYGAAWRSGADMLVRTGTTTVADIEAVPELLPDAWESTPLRVISLLEMLALTGRRPPAAILGQSLEKVRALKHPRNRAGLSPHAPYSTLPDLMTLCARESRKRNLLVCSHVAESDLEFEMFRHGLGEMYEWLKRSGRDMSDCGFGSPLRHMDACGMLGRNLVAAHVNYLGRGDITRLARNGVSVAHCPRSHAYFQHSRFPITRLLRAGVNVCLGTDSLATVHKTLRETVELDMFAEMRALAAAEPGISPRRILRMATVNGARALSMEEKLGILRPGSLADLIAVPFARGAKSVYEALLEHKGPVSASLIEGRWAIAPGAGSDGKTS